MIRYEFALPWPPSVNRYWRTPRGAAHPIISREGRQYRLAVVGILAELQLPPLDGDLTLEIDAFLPDRRKRDVDNLLKAPLDAMAHGGLYADDSQVRRLVLERRDVTPGGSLLVRIGPYA